MKILNGLEFFMSFGRFFFYSSDISSDYINNNQLLTIAVIEVYLLVAVDMIPTQEIMLNRAPWKLGRMVIWAI